jgi:hypothetical protein
VAQAQSVVIVVTELVVLVGSDPKFRDVKFRDVKFRDVKFRDVKFRDVTDPRRRTDTTSN